MATLEYRRKWYAKHKIRLRAKARLYAKNNPDKIKLKKLVYKKKNKKQFLARRLTSQAIYHGRLKKLPCKICGKRKVEAHHLDYSNWKNIMWLCKSHHTAWHRVFVC